MKAGAAAQPPPPPLHPRSPVATPAAAAAAAAAAPLQTPPLGGRWRHLVVHCRKAPFDVYVGRASAGAPKGDACGWDNPFTLRHEGERAVGIANFGAWLAKRPALVTRARAELRRLRGNVRARRGRKLRRR